MGDRAALIHKGQDHQPLLQNAVAISLTKDCSTRQLSQEPLYTAKGTDSVKYRGAEMKPPSQHSSTT